LVLVSGIVLTTKPVSAQIGGAGSIQGVVSDPSGAVVPNATVTATNVATGVATTRQTTQAGYYVLSPLNAGNYTISVTAPGFQKLTQEHVVVDALAQVGLNLTMQIGAAAEEVTVSAAPPQLDTSDASMGQTMRNEIYGALPLQMGNAPRDPTAFTQFLPGVTTGASTGNTAGNVLGSQEHSQEIYVEGLPTTNPSAEGESRTLGLGISVEAVDQFQLEFGRNVRHVSRPGCFQLCPEIGHQRIPRGSLCLFPKHCVRRAWILQPGHPDGAPDRVWL
jgi:hypothetical protein